MTQDLIKDGLTDRESTAIRALETLVPPSVPANIMPTLPAKKINALLNSIEHHLDSGHGTSIIHFVSAYRGEGADAIALETAYAAAAQTGKKVLFIDTGIVADHLRSNSVPSIQTFLGNGQSSHSPFLAVSGIPLFFAALHESEETDGFLPAQAALKALFEKTRQIFDLVIVHSESALTHQSAVAISKQADGNIIVIEAERTRIPVIKKLNHTLETNGAKVIGSVLTNRKFYIPDMLYPLLFKA
jgi:Mrp family chromosome partitioning ATPase